MKREIGDSEWTVAYETIAYRESMNSRVRWIDNGGSGESSVMDKPGVIIILKSEVYVSFWANWKCYT